MELRELLTLLYRNVTLIVACTLLGLTAGAIVTITTPAVYSAKTELYLSVRPAPASDVGEALQATTLARDRVKSYARVATSSAVLSAAIDELHLDTSPSALAERVTATTPPDTVLLIISVEDRRPQRAADIANAVARSTAAVTQTLDSGPGGQSPVQFTIVASAIAPNATAGPAGTINLLLGFVLGLAAGILLSVARNTLDRRVDGVADIENATGRRVLGSIPAAPLLRGHPLVLNDDPDAPAAEAFRRLRAAVQSARQDGVRCVVLTSTVPGEGTSTTAANLALGLAETGARVVLVEADLRTPSLAARAGLAPAIGLTEVLTGDAALADALQPWGRTGLSVLTAGSTPDVPGELLGTPRMHEVLDTLLTEFDEVLVDAPALLPSADAALVSRLAGATLLVTASGVARHSQVATAARILEATGSRVLGVVATMISARGPNFTRLPARATAVTHPRTPVG